MLNPAQAKIPLNPWQIQFLQSKTRIKTAICGRGSGKTNTLNHVIAQSARALPGAKASLNGITFGQALEIVLEQADSVWSKYGWHPYDPKTGRGNYVQFKRPPSNWPKAIYSPKKFDNCISFKSGYVLQLRSYDRPNSNRGGNDTQNFIDESGWFKEDWVNKIILPRNRAPIGFDSHLNLAFYHFSSVPWNTEGNWIFKYEELAQENPQKYLFQEATAADNYGLLAKVPDYIETQQALLLPIEFEVEMLNKRITSLPNGFYPSLSMDKHCAMDMRYDFDDALGSWHVAQSDYSTDVVINLSLDTNAAFTSGTLWQENKTTEHCFDALFVKPDQEKINMVEKLAVKFCEKYINHKMKLIQIYGDRNIRSGNAGTTETHLDVFTRILRKYGWRVAIMAGSYNWAHRDKFFFMDEILREENARLPKVRFNLRNAKVVMMSMQQTPILDNFEKDKKSERRSIPQELATHLSDTVDYYLCTKYGARAGRMSMGSSIIPAIGFLG